MSRFQITGRKTITIINRIWQIYSSGYVRSTALLYALAKQKYEVFLKVAFKKISAVYSWQKSIELLTSIIKKVYQKPILYI